MSDDIPLKLKTSDGRTISGHHYQRGHRRVVILAHGFFNNKDVYLLRKLAADLAVTHDVVSFDFRGHGQSSGLFDWTAREDQDLEAVIQYARTHGYAGIGLIGFSLGGAVALITAAKNRDIHTVIAVSAPCDFWEINFHFWEPEMLEDLKLNLGIKGVGKGVRPGNPFLPKVRPLDVVARISPTPVLFIHGAKDWLIKPSHSERLFKAASAPKRLEIVLGAGHAEKIYDTKADVFLGLCREWLGLSLR